MNEKLKFDKSRVYTVLNADELQVGSKVIVADNLLELQECVLKHRLPKIIKKVEAEDSEHRFLCDDSFHYALAYLVSETEQEEAYYVILNMNCKYEICRKCPKSGLFKGTYEECENWIKQKQKEEKKDEMKNRISMALKDPTLQQGFEIICKNLKELEKEIKILTQNLEDTEILNKTYEKRFKDLEKENAELKSQLESERDLPAIAYMQGAENQKKKDEEELKKWKDEWQEQVQKAIDEGYARTLQTIQLTKAKDIIKKFLLWENDLHDKTESKYELLKQAEQFIKDSEVEK